MIRYPRAVAAGGLALTAALTTCAAVDAGGPNIHAAEKAVEAKLGKSAYAVFPSVYATRTAVCGVVSSTGVGDDADARFLVEFAADAKGRSAPAVVLIDRPASTAEANAFAARWVADCNAT